MAARAEREYPGVTQAALIKRYGRVSAFASEIKRFGKTVQHTIENDTKL